MGRARHLRGAAVVAAATLATVGWSLTGVASLASAAPDIQTTTGPGGREQLTFTIGTDGFTAATVGWDLQGPMGGSVLADVFDPDTVVLDFYCVDNRLGVSGPFGEHIFDDADDAIDVGYYLADGSAPTFVHYDVDLDCDPPAVDDTSADGPRAELAETGVDDTLMTGMVVVGVTLAVVGALFAVHRRRTRAS